MNQKDNNPNFDFYSPFGSSEPQPSNEGPTQNTDAYSSDHKDFAPLLDEASATGALKFSYSRLGFALAAAIVLWLVFSAVTVAVGVMIWPELAENMMFSTLAGTLPLYVFCTPLVFFMISELPVGKRNKKTLSPSHMLVIFLMAQGLMWVGNFVGEGLMNLMGQLTGVEFYNQLNDTAQLPIWFIAILTGILAPVFEELIFRKLLLDRMIVHGEVCAIVVNGVLFGLFHGNFYQFFYAASLGMLLSYLYIRTGRVAYCMLLHVAVNFMGGIIPAILLQRIDYARYLALDLTNTAEVEAFYAEYGKEMTSLTMFSAAQIILGLAGIVLLILKFRQFKIEKEPTQLPARKSLKAAFFNVGILCAIAVCAFLIVVNILSYFPA